MRYTGHILHTFLLQPWPWIHSFIHPQFQQHLQTGPSAGINLLMRVFALHSVSQIVNELLTFQKLEILHKNMDLGLLLKNLGVLFLWG